MTARSEQEIRGNFLTHPFAELLAEVAAARLDGSLRVSNEGRKTIVYFKAGRVIFAVSNARSFRLFEMLLGRQKINKEDLARIPDFQNDFALTAFLKQNHFLTLSDIDALFAEQITAILVDVLAWRSGEWSFDHLARAREGLEFDVDVTELLVRYARMLPVEKMLDRFRSFDEKFSRPEVPPKCFELQPNEAFVLSRTSEFELTAADVISLSEMSEGAVLHAMYTLWIGGQLVRTDWQPAFAAASVEAMRSARIVVKREAKAPVAAEVVSAQKPQTNGAAKTPAEESREPEIDLSIEDYLERVESAATYYDILGVDIKAANDELKKAYFALARKFHPDRFHAEGGETFGRIQSAFGELAQAYETLKDGGTREVYDFRVRKEIAEREALRQEGEEDSEKFDSIETARAAENYEHGFTLLMDGEPEAAIAFLARAVHWDPNNARYHAYYGWALAADNDRRHKAESELQTAVKLDPDNQTFRMLLAEFFVNQNLPKRAEGELRRLLAIHPSNREAQDMLATLKNN